MPRLYRNARVPMLYRTFAFLLGVWHGGTLEARDAGTEIRAYGQLSVIRD